MDWNGSVVKPPSFEDEGALHVGKGRFLLFMSGDDESRKLSSQAQLILAVVAIVIVLAVLISAFTLSKPKSNGIPHRIMLGELMGSTLEQVSNGLNVSSTDWNQLDDGVFELNKPCGMGGVPFKLQLHFDGKQKLESFEYIAEYTVESKKAVIDVSEVMAELHLEAADAGKTSIRQCLEEGEPLNATSVWKHERTEMNHTVRKYLEEVESDSEWPGLLHGYLVASAVIYQDFHAEYTPSKQSVRIHINYSIEPERKN